LLKFISWCWVPALMRESAESFAEKIISRVEA
jgi:hypothetical protein